MKALILLALIGTISLLSCTKTYQTPDRNSPFFDTIDHRHASIEGGVVILGRIPTDPVYVRLPTVTMIAQIPNNFVIDFTFNYAPNLYNGGGNITASNFHVYGADYATGISKLIPGTITSWRNYLGSNLIYATIRAKWTYYVPIAANEFQDVTAYVEFYVVYNTLTGMNTITSKVVSTTP